MVIFHQIIFRLLQRYPYAFHQTSDISVPEIDNLYIDMN